MSSTCVTPVRNKQHVFPVIPFVTPSLWKAVQDFNMLCIRLEYVEESKVSRLEWENAADFFMTDLGLWACGPFTVRSFIEKVTDYRTAGRSIGIARTKMASMIIPTDELMEYCLKTPNFLPYLPNFFLIVIWRQSRKYNELWRKSEICAGSDHSRVSSVSTEHYNVLT
jgi:hypothetical protein